MPENTVTTRPIHEQDFSLHSLDPILIECPPWCELAGRHRLEAGAVDRVHYGPSRHVTLELEDLERWEDHRNHDWHFNLVSIRTYTRQNYRDREASINIGKGDEMGVTLTLSEAAQLVEHLSACLSEAGQ